MHFMYLEYDIFNTVLRILSMSAKMLYKLPTCYTVTKSL